MQRVDHTGVKFVLYFIFLFFVCLRIILLYFLPLKEGSIVTVSGYIYTNITRSSFRLAGVNIKASNLPELNLGDHLQITGRVVNGVVVAETFSVQRSGFDTLRPKIVTNMKKVFRPPYLGLVLGMGIGDKSNISRELYSKLKVTGLVHIVVASGSNIALLVSIVMPLCLQVMNRRKAILVCLLLVWGYVVVITFEAPIVRASIMATFALLAQFSGRLSSSVRSILFAAGIMLIINPSWIYDIGFYMSFSATFALILLPHEVGKFIPTFVPSLIKSTVSTSFSAQLGVIPVSLIFFDQVNLLGFVTNILITPVVPIIATLSFVTIAVGFVSIFLAKVVSFLVYLPLYWFLFVVDTFS